MSEPKKIKINLPNDRAEARYSDFAVVGKNALGFTFDFGQRMPGGDSITIVSRIAMSPQHAKLLLKVLSKNVEEYEKQFNEIKLPTPAEEVRDDKVIHFVK